LKKDVRDKGDPPVETQVSEWTPLLSKLLRVLVQLDPNLVSDYNGLCLKDGICGVRESPSIG